MLEESKFSCGIFKGDSHEGIERKEEKAPFPCRYDPKNVDGNMDSKYS